MRGNRAPPPRFNDQRMCRDVAWKDACRGAAEAYGMPEDYLMGANVVGFERVAAAMLAQGVI